MYLNGILASRRSFLTWNRNCYAVGKVTRIRWPLCFMFECSINFEIYFFKWIITKTVICSIFCRKSTHKYNVGHILSTCPESACKLLITFQLVDFSLWVEKSCSFLPWISRTLISQTPREESQWMRLQDLISLFLSPLPSYKNIQSSFRKLFVEYAIDPLTVLQIAQFIETTAYSATVFK